MAACTSRTVRALKSRVEGSVAACLTGPVCLVSVAAGSCEGITLVWSGHRPASKGTPESSGGRAEGISGGEGRVTVAARGQGPGAGSCKGSPTSASSANTRTA